MRSIITVFFLSINKRLHLFSYFTETFCFKLFLVMCNKVYSSQDINIAVKLQHSTKLAVTHIIETGSALDPYDWAPSGVNKLTKTMLDLLYNSLQLYNCLMRIKIPI